MPQIIEGEDGVERIMIDGELYPAKKMIDIDGTPFKEKGYFSMPEENTSSDNNGINGCPIIVTSVGLDTPKEPTVADKAADMYDQMEKEHQRLLNMIKDAISHSILSASNNALQYSKRGKPWIKREIKIFNMFNENMSELIKDFQNAFALATYLTENWKYLKTLCKSDNIIIKCTRNYDPINIPAHIDANDIMTIKVYPNKRKMDNTKTTTVKDQLESMVDVISNIDDDDKILELIVKRICKYCEYNVFQNAHVLDDPDLVKIYIKTINLTDEVAWHGHCWDLEDGFDYRESSLKDSIKAKNVFTRPNFMRKFISAHINEIFERCALEGLFVYPLDSTQDMYVYTRPKWHSYIKYPWLRALMKERNATHS